MERNERVKEIRGNISSKNFAESINISPSMLSSIEKNRKSLSYKIAQKISEVYGINILWLMEGTGEKQTKNAQYQVQSLENAENIVSEYKDKYIRLLEENIKLKEKINEINEQKINELTKKIENTKNIEDVSKQA